jgi:2-oxoglutarate dehydrogenase E1 component
MVTPHLLARGVVSETLQLSQLPGYRVGGSIHIVVNNQVGFTTNPDDGRSTRYSSDVAKSIKAPVLLVNGDDVEACVRAMDIAFRFRQEFGEDVVIDLVCYRRFGHNEGDEPAFTQPKMYQVIKKHPTLLNVYQKELIEKGVITEPEAKAFYQEKIDNLQKILDAVREKPPEVKPDAFGGMWEGLRSGTLEDFEKIENTKCDKATLDKAAQVLTTPPENFNTHKKLLKLIEQRDKMYSEGTVDWGLGELLAYGSLCVEGTPVRLSGQDVNRGTFSHRHAGYFDGETGDRHVPLMSLSPDKGEFNIYNSPLSEFAVLGFEFGNASADPTFLTLWEAQFGDFANGAQIIIDQFLASSEEKWSRGCGLTLLLPHGYEGQGPEHSSARLERFLQLCAQANMQVCNLTTPANLFHALRRQVRRDFRKPLVIMSPKSLLRHPKVTSKTEELYDGQFYEVLEDSRVQDTKAIEKLVLCSGKLYYDLDKARKDNLDYQKASETTAVVRIEQLYPFPYTQLAPFLSGFPKLKKVVWAQEEPKNMGAWLYIRPKLRNILADVGLDKVELDYAGRGYRASPATGSPKGHEREQLDIIKQVFS